jgi:hypothetical protein
MATFHTNGKFYFTILGNVLRAVWATKNCLFAMFGCLPSSIHVSIDFACDDNNKVTNEIYQVPLYGSQGLHWLIIYVGIKL